MTNHPLTIPALSELGAFAAPPCLSLYQPTHRRHPENQQDPVRFRHGIEALAVSLRRCLGAGQTHALLTPFHELAADADFWNHTLDGLAVLSCAGVFRVFVLPRPLPELALVADSFHTKPLRRLLQSAGRYQVLSLSRHRIRLFEGDRDGIAEIELAPGVPRTITDALGDELTEPHQTVSSYGGIGGASSPMRHGQGGKKDEVDKDAERFFRAVDRAESENHSKPSGLPLILAALPEHHHLFRQVSHNARLLPSGIDANPDALDADATTCSTTLAPSSRSVAARCMCCRSTACQARRGWSPPSAIDPHRKNCHEDSSQHRCSHRGPRGAGHAGRRDLGTCSAPVS